MHVKCNNNSFEYAMISCSNLADYCKKISAKARNQSSSDDSDDNAYLRNLSDEEGETPFISHPFKVNDKTSIVMNIRVSG